MMCSVMPGVPVMAASESARRNQEVQQIVERLLKLQEENRRKNRPGQTKSAPSTPVTELRGPPRPLSRHDIYTDPRPRPSSIDTSFNGETPIRHVPYLHPLPAHCPVPQSYQPVDLKANFNKNNRHGLNGLSRSTPNMSPTGSPQHSDSESTSNISRRTMKKFRRRFRTVAPSERVINYYSCAIVSDILLHGTLYITDNYFAFYSNIFGYVNKSLIPIVNVSNIQKEKTAKFIPNAVGLRTFDGKAFVFSSLISRDATYKFMVHMWRKSRRLTDSDLESTLQGVTEEVCLGESGSNSGDSAVDFCDGDDGDVLDDALAVSVSTAWPPSATTLISSGVAPFTETSMDFGNDPVATRLASPGVDSYDGASDEVEGVVTSGSENDSPVFSSENLCRKAPVSDRRHFDSGGRVQWIAHREVIKTFISIGTAPFHAVKEGLQEITFLPRKSWLLLMSSSLIIFLLFSAAFMIYRVESLNDQVNSRSFHYGDLYEEVLQMQQKLHAATAQEIEKTLSHQIRQLVTVKQSLEALIYLLNTDHSRSSTSTMQAEHPAAF